MQISSVKNSAARISMPAEPASTPALTGDQRALIQAVKALNASDLFGHGNELTLVMDRATRRSAVRIVNKNTRETVQQIPAESVLRMAEEIKAGSSSIGNSEP